MMKFATVMRVAGLADYFMEHCPVAAVTPITLLDGKGRVEENENVRYAKPLFENNPQSFEEFLGFVTDEVDTNHISHMTVTITVDYVKCSFDGRSVSFSRRPPSFDPMDIGLNG